MFKAVQQIRKMTAMIAATPKNETERLQALFEMDLLDTDPEPEFDELVSLASAICDVPVGLVSLLDVDRQWFKAQVGLEMKETPRAVAFCDHSIRQTDVLVVEDASTDSRFAANPLVTDGPQFRFYAGMPVASPDGHQIGTLCVLDHKPRSLSEGQRTALKILATQVNARMELRIQRKNLARALQEAEDARNQLYASEARFRTFMDNSPFVSYMKDENGRYCYYNKQFSDQFGIDANDWLGKDDFSLFPEKEAREYRRHDMDVLGGGVPCDLAETTVNPDGSKSHWRSHKFPYTAPDGTKMLGGMSMEVTEELRREEALRRYQAELQEANHRLQNLVLTDALTGLYNRRGFDERLNAEFSLASRSGREFSVLLLDLDNFKHRNDTYGHPAGDETLRQLSRILQQTVRLHDLPARYGGEEFAVLLPDTTEAQAMLFAGRLLHAIRAHDWDNEPVTASMGIAALHPSTRTQERLISLADEALYVAKRFGKDRAVSYGKYYEQIVENIQAEQKL